MDYLALALAAQAAQNGGGGGKNPGSSLQFVAANRFGINYTKNWDGIIEYSGDNKTWTVWDGSTVYSSECEDGYQIFLRGKNNTHIAHPAAGSGISFIWPTVVADVRCTGDLMSLLDHEIVALGLGDVISMGPACFRAFLQGAPIVNTPAMSARFISKNGCAYLYYHCNRLQTAEPISAISIENYGLSHAFTGCSALLAAPAVNATTVGVSALHSLFADCTSMTSAPNILPATALDSSSYQYMFQNCTSLRNAPALPATELPSMAYHSMFKDCVSLENVPAMPATSFSGSSACYAMFQGCTALTKIPELPIKSLFSSSYAYMFDGCSSIKISETQTAECPNAYCIPPTADGTTATNALQNMFTNTGGTFTGTPVINTTYYTNATVIPAT